jgi:hypothetical protein
MNGTRERLLSHFSDRIWQDVYTKPQKGYLRFLYGYDEVMAE